MKDCSIETSLGVKRPSITRSIDIAQMRISSPAHKAYSVNSRTNDRFVLALLTRITMVRLAAYVRAA